MKSIGGKACILFLAIVSMNGCADWAPAFSDLVPRDHGADATKKSFEASLAQEMTPQSTIVDGRAWFRRHNIPLGEAEYQVPYELRGGFHPLGSQGFWAAWSIEVALKFDSLGKYLSHEITYSQSNW